MRPSVVSPRKNPLAHVPSPATVGSAAEAYELLDPASTVVLTGAGISTDSGIPDYRSPGSPERSPMTGDAFRASSDNRQLYWARGYVGWEAYDKYLPNQAHLDLAALHPAALVTQNVDGLHQAAGSEPVLELHGSLHRVVCLTCGRTRDRGWMQRRLGDLNPRFLETTRLAPIDAEINPDGDAEVNDVRGFAVPDCPSCGGLLKPDVVYFGELVKPEVAAAATAAVTKADGVLVLGTSLAVHSALRLVRQAAKEDKPVVIVTDGPSRADELATVRLVQRVAPFVAGWRETFLGASPR